MKISLTRREWPQKPSSRLSVGVLFTILQMNFYEKALFVKVDVAAAVWLTQLISVPFALCFYPHCQ
jgi:hypothetical protein